MGVAMIILFIYLGAGFSNGKGLGELLSPFNLFGFIFWLYIAFLVFLFFLFPNQKQGQKIGEEMKKKEGDYKVMYWTHPEAAKSMIHTDSYMSHWYHEWYLEMYRQERVLGDWCIAIEKAKRAIPECRNKIKIANNLIRNLQFGGKGEDNEEIKRYREIIEENKELIKAYEEDIEKYTKKLNLLGWNEDCQPLAPRTWEDVYEHIREYGTIL